MQGRGGLVRENGSIAAGKYGGHPPALDRHVGPTDGIDALMNSMKPRGGGGGVYGPLAQTEREQLGK